MSSASSEPSQKVPLALRRDTIVEFILELRFAPVRAGTGDLLPGMLAKPLESNFPEYLRLPVAELPLAIRQRDPDMKYALLHRLIGAGQSLALGDRVVNWSVLRPYPGWAEIMRRAGEIFAALRATDLIHEVERLSIRYSNLIPSRPPITDMALVKVGLQLGSFEPRPIGLHVRAEIADNSCISIVQVVPQARLQLPSNGEVIEGLLLDVDTSIEGPFVNIWSELASLCEKIHLAEKRVFFGLLADATLEELGPRWK